MKKETKTQEINEAIQITIAHGNELMEINSGYSKTNDTAVMKYVLCSDVESILSQDTRLTRLVEPGDTYYPPLDGFIDENTKCLITCHAIQKRGIWETLK